MGMPFYSRLWWNGKRGQARCGDVEVELRTAPGVLGHPVEIDYSEAHCGTIAYPPTVRLLHEQRLREMTPPEVAAVRHFLRRLQSTVYAYLRRGAT